MCASERYLHWRAASSHSSGPLLAGRSAAPGCGTAPSVDIVMLLGATLRSQTKGRVYQRSMIRVSIIGVKVWRLVRRIVADHFEWVGTIFGSIK